MGHELRIARNLVYTFILVVAAVAGGIARGGIRWESTATQVARSTGWQTKAEGDLSAEALLPERNDLRLVLYLTMPEPELRPGAKVRGSLEPMKETPASRGTNVSVPDWQRQTTWGASSQIREWQPPPRAPNTA